MTTTAAKVKHVAVDDETTLSLALKAAGKVTAKDGTPVTFEVKKAADDSLVDTVDGKVQKSKAVAKWKAKGPTADGDERAWRVYYTVTVDGLTATSEELEVYLDTLELTSVDKDGASLADMRFIVKVGKDGKVQKKEGHTGSGGVVTVDGLKPGDLEVEWRAPGRLIEWEEEKAGKKKARLKVAPKAKLLFPTGAEHLQWVNHKADGKHPEQGSKLKVRVTVEDEDGPTRKGDQLFLKAVWADKATLSKRTVPKRDLAGGKKHPWSDPDLGRVVTIKADGAEATFELELGFGGGDEVTLHVGGTSTCEDAEVKVINWRKIYYQVTHRKTLATIPDLTRLTDALADVFVKYEPYKTKTYDEGDDGLPAGTYFDGAVLGKAGRVVCIGDHNKKWFHKTLFEDDKKPLGVHVLLCDYQLDGGSPKHHVDTHSVTFTAATQKLTTSASDRYPFPVALQDGKGALVSGSWRSLAPAGHPDAGKKGELVAGNLAFDTRKREITVTLPGVAAAIVGDGSGAPKDAATKHKVKVALKVKVVLGVFLGEADGDHGNWQLIAITAADTTNDVMAHELGHTMNQCVQNRQKPPPGLKASDHDRKYTGHGHQGPHCAEGMSATDFAADDYTGNAACKCIMYGENSSAGSKSNGKFCDKCKPFLVAERLTTM